MDQLFVCFFLGVLEGIGVLVLEGKGRERHSFEA